ncbi:hypothetical protein BDV95DRAFT_355235 [Massariosphaeria phaeospora]|uniref:Uncharacterized protein n=1 Tax=Massariosphaeria phaeospora TaxID=100035 RepID=A0A7C8I9B1_9PLEO|nr:hypothetical protein BDV95DRAFT_355235 [Massariosphaeria phaeospora]
MHPPGQPKPPVSGYPPAQSKASGSMHPRIHVRALPAPADRWEATLQYLSHLSRHHASSLQRVVYSQTLAFGRDLEANVPWEGDKWTARLKQLERFAKRSRDPIKRALASNMLIFIDTLETVDRNGQSSRSTVEKPSKVVRQSSTSANNQTVLQVSLSVRSPPQFNATERAVAKPTADPKAGQKLEKHTKSDASQKGPAHHKSSSHQKSLVRFSFGTKWKHISTERKHAATEQKHAPADRKHTPTDRKHAPADRKHAPTDRKHSFTEHKHTHKHTEHQSEHNHVSKERKHPPTEQKQIQPPTKWKHDALQIRRPKIKQSALSSRGARIPTLGRTEKRVRFDETKACQGIDGKESYEKVVDNEGKTPRIPRKAKKSGSS